MDLLEAILDPWQEEHRATLDWHNGPFDPSGLDEGGPVSAWRIWRGGGVARSPATGVDRDVRSDEPSALRIGPHNRAVGPGSEFRPRVKGRQGHVLVLHPEAMERITAWLESAGHGRDAAGTWFPAMAGKSGGGVELVLKRRLKPVTPVLLRRGPLLFLVGQMLLVVGESTSEPLLQHFRLLLIQGLGVEVSRFRRFEEQVFERVPLESAFL